MISISGWIALCCHSCIAVYVDQMCVCVCVFHTRLDIESLISLPKEKKTNLSDQCGKERRAMETKGSLSERGKQRRW